MAKKNTLAKGVGDTPTPKIIRNYDPMSMEKRIYDLEQNGSGGSTATTMAELYSGTTDVNIVLSEDYDKYDLILIIGRNSTDNVESALYASAYLAASDKIGIVDDSSASWYTVTDKKTFTRQSIASGKFIRKVYGIKF